MITTPPSHLDYLRRIRSSSVYNVAVRSPLEDCASLGARSGNRVLLKREDLQPVFSFKLRGAYNMMARLDSAVLDFGVIAASAGNHAQGVALAALQLKTTAKVVVPVTTPLIKQQAIRALGAELVVYGNTYDEAFEHANELAKSSGRTFVHPYDDPDVIAGQGTIGLEIHEQYADAIDAVFVPVGGGGLIAGIALALKQLRPSTRVIGVEPEDSNALQQSLAAGKRITLDRTGLFADGVAVRTPGKEPFRIAQELVDEVITVSNDAICGAIKEIFDDRRALLEPAGALAYAGLRAFGEQGKTFVAVATGANLNFDRLRHISERAQIGEHREAVIAIRIPERPGAFLALYESFTGRPITEFNYRLGDEDSAVVFVGVQVTDRAQRLQLMEQLASWGFQATDLTDDEIAKAHVRHMVGGRAGHVVNERVFHFDFPERPGALGAFLTQLGSKWNISLFHYRNHGSDVGRVLAGFQVPEASRPEFDRRLRELGYGWVDVSQNPAIQLFL